jgi:cobalt-zinc-cadmium efflux system protein
MLEHSHPHPQAADLRGSGQRRLALMLGLSATYMVAEAVGGWWTGSLALLADAGHMASDVASLALATFAMWVAQRPADARRTFGHTRAEILAALAQGVALIAVAILIVVEAFERLEQPPPVAGAGMLAIATGGLAVNLLGLWLLGHGRKQNLSLRGAWLHVASDALGSLGAMGAGAAVFWFGWRLADPIASLLIALLVIGSAWQLMREAVDVLMETAPRHLDVDEIRTALRRVAGVLDVHDLHVWTIGSGEISLSCHAVSQAGADTGALLATCNALLERDFAIRHATIQVEPATRPEPLDTEVGCTTACEPDAEPLPRSGAVGELRR